MAKVETLQELNLWVIRSYGKQNKIQKYSFPKGISLINSQHVIYEPDIFCHFIGKKKFILLRIKIYPLKYRLNNRCYQL